MRDWATMIRKEVAESFGHRRFYGVFGLVALLMGVLPALALGHAHGPLASNPATLLRAVYVLLAGLVMVANTAPDLVLHERVGRTLDYLLTTRLPDAAIFGAKLVVAAASGYAAAMLAMAVQLAMAALTTHTGWHWLFLGTPIGRVAAFGLTAELCVYLAVVGTFVALRVGEQRTAYMATMLSVGVILAPFVLGWLTLTLTAAWMGQAALVFGAAVVVLALGGLLLLRRERVVLYLQE